MSLMEEFLRGCVREAIQLVAIWPDGPIYGHWFGSDASAAAEWAKATNETGYNIYWTVNTSTPVTTKPSKADIVAARFIHVDIDPPKDGSQWDADVALAALLPLGPTTVIASGGGLQALWRLDAPLDPMTAEALNRGVIARVGGDPACWNMDRLLRVPGTVNYPDARKVARGRVPALATTLLPDTGARYTAEALTAAFPPSTRSPRERIADMPAYTLLSADDLVPPPGERLRTLIDAPQGDDRSRDTYAAAAELAACGYDDGAVLGILLNPANEISAHTLDQSNPERAALRALEVARRGSPAALFAAPVTLPADAAQYEPPATTRGWAVRGGYEIMSAQEQLDHFKGCVFVREIKKVVNADGRKFDKAQFDVEYGGYEFPVDRLGQRKGVTSAWDAFTQHRQYECPKVDMTCFRPGVTPGVVFIEEGITFINTYQPISTSREPGDISLFTYLLERLLPSERDRDILLHWMASCVQNPGRKFQWWPVIQGTPGNGKTALLTIMMHAMGHRYSHLVNPEALIKTGNQFSGWVEGKLFLGFEEICVGHDRRGMLDTLKPIVTNRRMAMERKGVDQYTSDNYANGIALTNHKEAMPIDNSDRRWAVFFTAQQDVADLDRDGLTEQFFAGKFYPWLDTVGCAYVTHWLANMPLRAELDPAKLCVRAPTTSSRPEVLAAGLGRVEQDILAAIEEEQTGFRGGFVSSRAVDLLIERTRSNVPRNKRPEMMRKLGYDYHPALPEGRTSRAVVPDGVRVRLYIKRGHLVSQLVDPGMVARRYEEAQSVGYTASSALG